MRITRTAQACLVPGLVNATGMDIFTISGNSKCSLLDRVAIIGKVSFRLINHILREPLATREHVSKETIESWNPVCDVDNGKDLDFCFYI